jgi:CubicO group peptidase (beta-lactamase class C family)
MFQKIRDENIDVHSVLLVRNGHLVSEAYFDPYTQDRKHPVFSVTKSVTSMLTGIALEEGYITSVDQKVLDFFPDIAKNTRSEYLQSLTLEHLLTMSAGYNTRTIPFFEVLEQKDESFDTIEHILTYNSILYKPGTTFYYDSGAPHLLSAIIQETAGMSTQAYAQEKLFDPLGISGITWQTDPRGIPLGCTGLELSPRDMAKLGYLYLNRGQWNGAQIVPAAWIEQSTTKHIETKGLMNEAEDDGYGYFWWMDAYGGYSAHGFGGQYIFVVPRLNLVAVFTGGLADPDFPTPRKLIETFILPAVKSAGPLPASPATSDLQEYLEQIKNPAPQPVAPLPEIAKQISGQTYKIIGSPDSYIQAITLNFKEGQNLYELEAMRLGEKYEVRGGLDRFYVNGPENGHVIALKGYWQDENTFVETLKDFDYIETITQKYTFAGNTLSMDISASTGYSLQLKGKVEAN